MKDNLEPKFEPRGLIKGSQTSEIDPPRSDTRSPVAGDALARFLAAIRRNPGKSLYLFCAIHLVIWTVVPSILCRDLPLDMIEGIAFGQEFQLGYWKHPPLPWWILGAIFRIVGPHLWVYFLVGAFATTACMWTIWRLGCEILESIEAFAAAVLLEGYISMNFYATAFNNGIIQLPLFGAIGWLTYRSLIHERPRDWVLVGIFCALAFYSKYEAVILIIPLLLFAAIEPRARNCWRTPGPYVAMLVFLVLIAPQALWVIEHQFSPILFFDETAEHVSGFFHLLLAVAIFAGNSAFIIAPMVIMFIALDGSVGRRPSPAEPAQRFVRRYIATLAFGPFSVAIITELLLRRSFSSIWATQFWCFASLYLMLFWRPVLDQTALLRLGIAWGAVIAMLIGVEIGSEVFLIASGRNVTTQFPGRQFSAAVSDIWQRQTDQPLKYVIGEFWLAGNVILFSTDRLSMYASASQRYSPWIDEGDVFARGAMLLWSSPVGKNEVPEPPTMPPELQSKFPTAMSGDSLIFREPTADGERVWRIGWALLRPAEGAPR